jgi:DNA-directed RNA polymerase specialized sigma24 family protein
MEDVMTKEELSSYRTVKHELVDIEKRIQQLRCDARALSGIRYSDMPHERGEAVPAVERYIEQLEELSLLYENKKTELLKKQICIERAIAELPPRLRIMMRRRYIDGAEWYKINAELCISKDTSMRWQREALRKVSTS